MRPRADLSLTHRLDALLRPAFLFALALLIANDWLFKPLFHNALTGKLSDFAGVYAFAYACGVLMARRLHAVHVVVALAFIWWKSPESSAAIAAWNTWTPWPIARVVDPWDLLALVVLPFSLRATQAELLTSKAVTAAPRWPRFAVALVALVAFTATSRRPTEDIPVDAHYRSALELQVMERVVSEHRDLHAEGDRVQWWLTIEDCNIQTWFQAYPHYEPGSAIVVYEAMAECEVDSRLRSAFLGKLDTFMREVLHAEHAVFPDLAFRAHDFGHASAEHAGTPRTECKDPRQDTAPPTDDDSGAGQIEPSDSAR